MIYLLEEPESRQYYSNQINAPEHERLQIAIQKQSEIRVPARIAMAKNDS